MLNLSLHIQLRSCFFDFCINFSDFSLLQSMSQKKTNMYCLRCLLLIDLYVWRCVCSSHYLFVCLGTHPSMHSSFFRPFLRFSICFVFWKMSKPASLQNSYLSRSSSLYFLLNLEKTHFYARNYRLRESYLSPMFLLTISSFVTIKAQKEKNLSADNQSVIRNFSCDIMLFPIVEMRVQNEIITNIREPERENPSNAAATVL